MLSYKALQALEKDKLAKYAYDLQKRILKLKTTNEDLEDTIEEVDFERSQAEEVK